MSKTCFTNCINAINKAAAQKIVIISILLLSDVFIIITVDSRAWCYDDVYMRQLFFLPHRYIYVAITAFGHLIACFFAM